MCCGLILRMALTRVALVIERSPQLLGRDEQSIAPHRCGVQTEYHQQLQNASNVVGKACGRECNTKRVRSLHLLPSCSAVSISLDRRFEVHTIVLQGRFYLLIDLLSQYSSGIVNPLFSTSSRSAIHARRSFSLP